MPSSCQFALYNATQSSQVYAYITGIAIQHNGARCLMKANGRELYFPKSPSEILQPLAEDCAIPLGPPGNTITITVPQLAGGRLWFSVDGKLTFLLNPGPALVEPSVLNPTDPNAHINFSFCEFTLNNDQLFANISYVDFVSQIPIALSLRSTAGAVQTVSGMSPNGLDQVCDKLREQAQRDGRPWDRLIVQHAGRNLRALNATHGAAVNANFDSYFESHVDAVWLKYSQGARLRINTQAGPGILDGHVTPQGDLLIGRERFSKPSTADILGCNSGPFTTGPSAERNAIIPRLAAAFVRTTLLVTEDHPSHPHTFYTHEPTNHYARIVHECNRDGKGYAFAYDDVQPDGGDDQSGKVNDGAPALFTVTVGGGSPAVSGGNVGGTAPQQGGYQRAPPPPPPGVSQTGEYRRAPPPPPPVPSKHGLRAKLGDLAHRIVK